MTTPDLDSSPRWNPDRWRPDGESHGRLFTRPREGDLVGWRYGAWRVESVRVRGDADLTADELRRVNAFKEGYRDGQRPYDIVLVHERGPLLCDRVEERADGARAVHLGVPVNGAPPWRILTDRYPVCVCHMHPYPCMWYAADQAATAETAQMDRVLAAHTPGICLACREPISQRMHAIVFPEPSLIAPGLPGPSFHAGRLTCWRQARRYELDHRLPAYSTAIRLASCPGFLFEHTADGRYECTLGEVCTGHHGTGRDRLAQPCNKQFEIRTKDEEAAALQDLITAGATPTPARYPVPPGICSASRCLGRYGVPGLVDPLTVGDTIDR